MIDRIKFFLNRLGERLWVKPLAMCLVSIAGALLASAADRAGISHLVPEISSESVNTLLSVLSASMLVIATFSVGSMVSAYASAGSTATPRAFRLMVSDDVSQNALSTFIGAFIYSIIALVALENGFYEKAGRFALLVLTLIVFAIVVLTFVRWVDRIARLGRLGSTVDKVEAATSRALDLRRRAPTLGGVPVNVEREEGQAVYGESIGYVQRIDVPALQSCAEELGARITLAALPGTFSAPGRALAYVTPDSGEVSESDPSVIARAFVIDSERLFDDDPRFGLIVLSEIASRALSPAVNDPGTAIGILGAFVRLFTKWSSPMAEEEQRSRDFDRVEVPELALEDMFDDAFTSIARDGAGSVEVAVRLQKTLESLTVAGDGSMAEVARRHGRRALRRVELTMELAHDLETVRAAAEYCKET